MNIGSSKGGYQLTEEGMKLAAQTEEYKEEMMKRKSTRLGTKDVDVDDDNNNNNDENSSPEAPNADDDYEQQQQQQGVAIVIEDMKKSKNINENVGKTKKITNKKKQDPNHPKRAKAAYNFFYGAIAPLIMKDKSIDVKFNEMGKYMGNKWQNTSSEEKQIYEVQAKQDKERYKREMADYRAEKEAAAVGNNINRDQEEEEELVVASVLDGIVSTICNSNNNNNINGHVTNYNHTTSNSTQQHNIKEKYIVKRTGCTSAKSTITWGSKPHKKKKKTVKKSKTTKKKLKKMKHNYDEDDDEEEEEIDYDYDSDSMTNINEYDDNNSDDDDENNDDEYNNQGYYYYEDNMWKIKKKKDIIDDEHEHENNNQKVEVTTQQHKISREERMKRREEQQILQQLKKQKQKVTPDKPRPFENGEAEVNPQQQNKNNKKRRRSSGKSKFHEYIPSEGEVALMSDYEKLRYHKMKRNQERLSQLGLV